MATSFAALESRLNAVALAKFANATATISGAVVEGTFDAEYQEVLGMSAAKPTFIASAQALAGAYSNTALTIDCAALNMAGVPYTVAEMNNEHGMKRLWLRKAS